MMALCCAPIRNYGDRVSTGEPRDMIGDNHRGPWAILGESGLWLNPTPGHIHGLFVIVVPILHLGTPGATPPD